MFLHIKRKIQNRKRKCARSKKNNDTSLLYSKKWI